jgi:DNA-binding transcriptional ArsR family regulator
VAITKHYNWYKKAELLKVMAHADRLAILNLLVKNRDGKLTVKKIYEKLNLRQPIASRHLNILRTAGVVSRLQHGQNVFYCLCADKDIGPLIECCCS